MKTGKDTSAASFVASVGRNFFRIGTTDSVAIALAFISAEKWDSPNGPLEIGMVVFSTAHFWTEGSKRQKSTSSSVLSLSLSLSLALWSLFFATVVCRARGVPRVTDVTLW